MAKSDESTLRVEYIDQRQLSLLVRVSHRSVRFIGGGKCVALQVFDDAVRGRQVLPRREQSGSQLEFDDSHALFSAGETFARGADAPLISVSKRERHGEFRDECRVRTLAQKTHSTANGHILHRLRLLQLQRGPSTGAHSLLQCESRVR